MRQVHPIETQSYRIIAERVDISHLGPAARAVVLRVIHATADLEFATTMVVDERAAQAGAEALRRGAPVITDTQMVRHGLRGVNAVCYLDAEMAEVGAHPDLTRAAAGIRLGARRHPSGAIFAVGCAPTALAEVIRLAATGENAPALVIGVPVGFVGAAQAKEALRLSGLPAITNIGDKGGSAMAAAVVNALVDLSSEASDD